MLQLFLLILTTGCLYLLIALSFTLLYYPGKFFNLAHAAIITISAYFSFLLIIQLKINQFFSIPIAVILSTCLGLIIEFFIYKPLRKKNPSTLVLLILSLGLYIILQNTISLLWGNDTKSIQNGAIDVGNNLWGAYITNTQILIILISLFIFIAVNLFLKSTEYGKQIRAVSSNRELSATFGINIDRIILSSTAIGSGLGAISGILVAYDTNMTPFRGFNLLLYGIVAMIIGGVNSMWGLIGGSFLLATAQHLGAYYIDSKWMDAIAYIILILFLLWKPLGFSGKRLKKVEI